MSNLSNFKILVLGGSGAGKTVFLASMYKQLSLQREKIGFFVQAEGTDRADLVKSYLSIADPQSDWPHGTSLGDMRNWHFTCSIESGGSIFDVMSFDYLDYPGGIITDGASNYDEVGFDIDEEASSADSLLVLLDGHKILNQMLNRETNSMVTFHQEIAFSLPIIQRNANKPVHFLITKWDLFDNADISFRDVRNTLMDIEELNTIINARVKSGNTAQTRLIPVSAVGNGFASLEADGRMKKTGNPAKPFHVELPMVCTLLDGFESAHKHLLERAESEEKSWWKLKLGTKKTTVSIAMKLLHAAQFIVPIQYKFSLPIVQALFEYVDRKLKKGTGMLESEVELMKASIKDQESATQAAICSYMFLADRLEQEFPESDLSRL